MFKRPLKTKSHSSVKKSERKHLLEAICAVHSALKPDDLRKCFFPDGEDILCLKVETLPAESAPGPAKSSQSAPTSFHIYCNHAKQPYFTAFDIVVSQIPKTTFLTTYMPTLYAVWQLPSMVPLSFITHGEVIAKLQKGAKLMLAGATPTDSCLDALQSAVFRKNEAYATVMCGMDHPSVVGVGRVLMDSEELRQRLSGDGERRGELLEILHMVDDELWALGDKSSAGDYEQIVSSASRDAGSAVLTQEGKSDENDSQPVENVEGTSDSKATGETNQTTNVQGSADTLFRKIFLTTLKSRVSEGSLPMLVSTLNKHILDVRSAAGN